MSAVTFPALRDSILATKVVQVLRFVSVTKGRNLIATHGLLFLITYSITYGNLYLKMS